MLNVNEGMKPAVRKILECFQLCQKVIWENHLFYQHAKRCLSYNGALQSCTCKTPLCYKQEPSHHDAYEHVNSGSQ